MEMQYADVAERADRMHKLLRMLRDAESEGERADARAKVREAVRGR